MWARLLYRLRWRAPDWGRLLQSWKLSVVLMVLAIFYYVLVAVWSVSSPPHVVGRIASLLPFWLVWVGLLVNTAFCLWARRARIRQEAPTFLFHGAFFLVAAGFVGTLLARQETKVRVAVDEDYTAAQGQVVESSEPKALGTGVPELSFRVESVEPEFWGEMLLFTELKAQLAFPDGSRATTRINRPLWLGWDTFLRLSGFGYAPRYELKGGAGESLDSAFVKLNVFPPGQRDWFVPQGWPHRIYLEVFPDYEPGPNGAPGTKTLNLRNPALAVRVLRGKADLGSALLQGTESIEYEGLRLNFPEIHVWGEFSIVRDPGAPLLFLGYGFGLAGLIWKLATRAGNGDAT